MNNQIEALIPKYLFNFYGMGNPKSKIWFVGMEPGGGNSLKEVNEVISSWKKCGAKKYTDIFEHHEKIITSRHIKSDKYPNLAEYFFGEKNKLQSTWEKLIKLFISYYGGNSKITKGNLREFQRTKWGKSNSENCLVELLPLPAPKKSKWKYNLWFPNISYLINRNEYERKVLGKRKKIIHDEIFKFKPKVVVFYGKGYLQHWEDISGCKFRSDSFQKCKNILFAIINHPAAFNKKGYFEDMGMEIKNRIESGHRKGGFKGIEGK